MTGCRNSRNGRLAGGWRVLLSSVVVAVRQSTLMSEQENLEADVVADQPHQADGAPRSSGSGCLIPGF